MKHTPSETMEISLKVRGSRRLVPGQVNNILIRGTNWIGDAVLTLPAVAAVRKTFSGAGITVLAKPWVADIYRLSPDVDEVMLYQRPGIHQGVSGLFRLVGELRARNFDTAILLQNAIEAALIVRLAGITNRAGYNSDGRGWLLTHSVLRTAAIREVYQIDYYLEMVKALGCQSDGREILLKPGPDDDAAAGHVLQSLGLIDTPLMIGMAPGATYGPAKKWFPERFAAVAEKLIDGFGARVFLFGSNSDKASTDAVQQHTRRPLVDLAGKTNLKETIALMARCRLFISNDSGLMHVASALGIPTIAIFGSTNPVTTGPAGNKSVIVHRDVACSPCLKETCPTDFRCMDLITVDDVYETARQILTENPSVGSG